MKILLLNPPFIGKFSRTSRSPAVTRGGTIYYPFWLAYAAGVLDREGFEVKIIDAPAEGYDSAEIENRAVQMNPRLIVVDTSTPSIYSDIKTAEKLKNILPDAFIVLVGTHPSALPEETLRLSDKLDAVAKGEYDYTVRDLARCLKNNGNLEKIDGLIFRNGDKIIFNQPRALIENLDELPFASQIYKKHLDIKKYFFVPSDYPMVMIITGRGCPFRCFFCVYPQTFHSRAYRFRSPGNVADEFEYIARELPEVREVGIEDDTFTADRMRAREICRLIIQRGIKIKWYCNVRPNLDKETMTWMKKAGCQLVTVGFESANQQILDNIRKGIRVAEIKEFVKNAKEVGLLVHGCFMAGNPGETKQTLEEMLEFAKILNCDTMQFYPLQVYPGTEAYVWAKENGYLATDDFSKWATAGGGYTSLLNLPGLSAEDLAKFCRRATKAYYLRRPYLFMKIKQLIRHPSEFRRTIRGAATFFKNTFLAKNYE